MQEAMYIAYTGARAAELKMEKVANNLANASSAGYKQDKFVDTSVVPMTAFSAWAELAANPADPPGGLLMYQTPSVEYVDLSPGPVHATGNPFDLALEGDGYFTVSAAEGERLTRAGNFRVDAAGDLAIASGEKVLGTGGPIRVGEGAFTVSQEGEVAVDGAAVGTLKIQKPADPSRMIKAGRALFEVPADVPLQPAGKDVTVHQGNLEQANVSAVGGMTDMVEASRMFDAYMKMIQTISDINAKAANELAKV